MAQKKVTSIEVNKEKDRTNSLENALKQIGSRFDKGPGEKAICAWATKSLKRFHPYLQVH